jgi:hypothetical protein
MNIMRKVNGVLVKAVLDSVYYKGSCETSIPHKMKELKIHDSFKEWYTPISGYNMYDMIPFRNKALDIPDGYRRNVVVLTGAGGTGKTYSILTDKTIINPMVVVPVNNIGKDHRNTFGANYITIHRLIGIKEGEFKCIPWKDDNPAPGVVFLDELSMIQDSWIDKALTMYPDTMFYIAGDVTEKQWFQCRSGHPGAYSKIWLIPSDVHKIEYTTDYRAAGSPELMKMKLEVRQKMRDLFESPCDNGGKMDSDRINVWVQQTYPTISFSEAISQHQNGDIWLASTHETHRKLIANNIVSGWKMPDKSVTTEKTDSGTMRGSFTIHAHQGLTIDSAKVFIVLDSFEYAMFYTALSRLRRIQQLVIVRNPA